MSHLTEFSMLLAYIKRRLRYEESSGEKYRDHGRFGGVPVHFPLGIPRPSQVAKFYSNLNAEVEGSQLDPERKTSYRRFISAAYLAHRAADENQPQSGSVWHLEDCLDYITKALRLMERSKEYDDGHPVHWSEVYPPEHRQNGRCPEEHWMLFKLESLLPVLRLSVRIFRLAFPDCEWDEWERSLCHKQWLQQFILDSRASSREQMPLHAPRLVDIIGPSAFQALQRRIEAQRPLALS
ncbi:hypothetical protein SAMD00023353_4200460 [Rosellinia necatrix]|uniref:Uncharacterized protein n=1 Tax=Rosellinia necatrix TaxID=77044 RepID=A0A1W2TP83_ROSNE|nr:hypothetical protein SAMD00023353_4200460 [Rosellinia necatrix]